MGAVLKGGFKGGWACGVRERRGGRGGSVWTRGGERGDSTKGEVEVGREGKEEVAGSEQ